MGAGTASSFGRVNDDGSSQSGNERNHFFLNRGCGAEFLDVSGISGLDNIADGRSFALWDFDQDGWQDIALANANTPLLSIYRNRIGELAGAEDIRSAALRFIGGNHQARANSRWSNRDGYGLSFELDVGERTLLRERRCGEGLAAQNSSTMVIGLGEHDGASELRVRWPSGVEQTLGSVRAGTLVTVYENPDDSPTGEPRTTQPYGKFP